MRRTLTALVAATALALTASACGSAADQAGGGGDGKKSGPGSGKGSVTVKDVKGEQRLDGPAKKVVALEWTYAEDLLALGVQPTGVADIEQYNQWVTAGPRFAKSTKDVGTRQAPSLESIKALKPDLIVTSKIRSEANYKQLNEIAPTLMFDPYATDSEFEEMRTTLKTLGTATGKQDAAQAALKELDGKIAAAKKKVADGKKTGSDSGSAAGSAVTVARGYTTDGAATVEILTDSTIPGALLPKLGLKNGWNGKSDAYGMSKVDVEGLKPVEKSSLAYVAAKNDDVFAKSLPKNALWKNLDFVKQDRVHALDPGTWFFGGPYSTAQAADEIATALTD